ncbi:hypothetical protein FUAX_09480 [Fulvitalea axinellae]|uniref:Uncharacterized protein n=1 Tax=Fulvitalea axinellae TaxID=1182444 RepID=A0AAU9D6P5_9BACT|nr:hypothetical protein FUAX_09480 [Fulvitalea axinellae]
MILSLQTGPSSTYKTARVAHNKISVSVKNLKKDHYDFPKLFLFTFSLVSLHKIKNIVYKFTDSLIKQQLREPFQIRENNVYKYFICDKNTNSASCQNILNQYKEK